jgi:hypothetical protein
VAARDGGGPQTRRDLHPAGPLVYLTFFLLVACSLNMVNADTGFRYRTHLVAVGICIVRALWQLRRERAAQPLPAAASRDTRRDRYVPTPT